MDLMKSEKSVLGCPIKVLADHLDSGAQEILSEMSLLTAVETRTVSLRSAEQRGRRSLGARVKRLQKRPANLPVAGKSERMIGTSPEIQTTKAGRGGKDQNILGKYGSMVGLHALHVHSFKEHLYGINTRSHAPDQDFQILNC